MNAETPRPNIELHIEELVLHGFAPAERYRIGAAIEQELTRLFGERGVPPTLAQGGEIKQMNVGAFNVAPGAKSAIIGAQVAQSVYEGLGNER